MIRDLRDAWSWIEKLIRRIERVESGAILENSSITNGRMRFIGGLLRIDSGGQIEVVGEWRFTGNGAITGDVVAEGKWTQNGAWEFNGNGDIAGNVEITAGGKLRVGNMTLNPSIGSGSIVFDNGAQVFTSGDTIQLYGPGGNFVAQVESDQAWIGSAGRNFRATTDGRYLSLLPVTTATTGLWNVVVDADGKLYRKAI